MVNRTHRTTPSTVAGLRRLLCGWKPSLKRTRTTCTGIVFKKLEIASPTRANRDAATLDRRPLIGKARLLPHRPPTTKVTASKPRRSADIVLLRVFPRTWRTWEAQPPTSPPRARAWAVCATLAMLRVLPQWALHAPLRGTANQGLKSCTIRNDIPVYTSPPRILAF